MPIGHVSWLPAPDQTGQTPRGYPAQNRQSHPVPAHFGHNTRSPEPPLDRTPWAPQNPPGLGFAPGSTYGGFGVFEGIAEPKRSKKPWIAGAIALVVLAGAGLAAWLLGAFRGEVLDQQSVQDGVRQILREDFGEGEVGNVSCPKDEPVKTGITFDCTLTVAGNRRRSPFAC